MRYPLGSWALSAFALAVLAGCAESTSPAAARSAIPADAGQPRVVVAILDSGINPYHAWFHASRPGSDSPIYPRGAPPSSVTPQVLAEFGIDEDHIITPTRTGKPADDFAADAAQWARVRPREAYWFRGTNIIAVGRDAPGLAGTPDGGPLILPDDAADTHGVATTAAALLANPDAIIYFVEHNNDATSPDIGSEDIHDIGFLHPAVDIVSTSYARTVQPEVKAFFRSFEAVVRRGKLHFAGGYNAPWLTFTQAGAGPWWSIGVTGLAEGETNGRTASSYFTDFVGDDFQDLPSCVTCQEGTTAVVGTSFAAPRAAGVASRVLLEARRRLDHRGGVDLGGDVPVTARGEGMAITNWQLRRALEEAAYVPTFADYEPSTTYKNVPVQDQAPWLQVGWGLLTPDPARGVVDEALARLGFGSHRPDKPAGFCDFQTKLIEARHRYWDTVSPLADAVIPDYVGGQDLDTGGDAAGSLAHDPFVYCGSTLPPV